MLNLLSLLHVLNYLFYYILVTYILAINLVVGRDSGNDFRITEIVLDNSRSSFKLFSYPHVVPSCFSKSLNDRRFLELTFISGAD